MRLSLRFILPLVAVLALIAYAIVPLVDMLTVRWFVRDVDMRSKLIANTMEAPVTELLSTNAKAKLLSYLHRISQDERLYALGICVPSHQLIVKTQMWPEEVSCDKVHPLRPDSGRVLKLKRGPVHIAAAPLGPEGRPIGWLLLLHDMSFVQQRSSDTRWYIFYVFLLLGVVISVVTVLVAHLSWKGWVAGVRAMMRGEGLLTPLSAASTPELRPLEKDLRELVRALETDRRVRDESQITWTAGTLKTILHEQLSGDEIMIVSNRQPYIHNRRDGHIEVQMPASGVVTALEPVMRACSGVWVAHGNGTADQEVVDDHDRIRVPPEAPEYSIRRIWITPEEEAGYYYGFSNEGLWPLCHTAHIRPTFRSADWKDYVTVNERFARTVYEEAKTDNPVILIQDYHFALLPKLLRELMPKSTVITFWHIPWPNAERYGICPWREEILTGLLGSSILGFHTRLHCNNFIDSVDRFLEARIDRDHSTISRGGHPTAVNHYPISIEWPIRWAKEQRPIKECRRHIRELHGMEPEHLVGVGVERLDYTKGILERFMAIERLLELEPEWIGKFSFVQIAAPSRSSIPQYRHFTAEVFALAERINKRFGEGSYTPIYLNIQHHEPPEVFTYYRGADFCVVSSLHDGMNLVAKEFVAARDDERGVLILSQFAGAARELPEALIINPYDSDQFAAALHVALTMPPAEQRARMMSMRALIQEFNVYRWAGRMLIDAARMRQLDRLTTRSQ